VNGKSTRAPSPPRSCARPSLAQVKARQRRQQASGQARAQHPRHCATLTGCADQHVGAAALTRDALHDRYELVSVLYQQVRPEDAGQPTQGVQLLGLLGGRLAPRHPEDVELGAESLGRAPGAADDALGLRRRGHKGQQPFADRLGDIAVEQALAPAGDRDEIGARRQPLGLDIFGDLS
jgi:hypothetical protein